MCRKFPGRLVLGIDARDGLVATDGWLETSHLPATQLAQQFAGEPLDNLGRAADGTWLIDLSGSLPPSGLLGPGQSTTGQTITVRVFATY